MAVSQVDRRRLYQQDKKSRRQKEKQGAVSCVQLGSVGRET